MTNGPTGLQYNRARYYDPKAGRWISQDPTGFSAGDNNLYRYLANNPTDDTDPSGLHCATIGMPGEDCEQGPQQPTNPKSVAIIVAGKGNGAGINKNATLGFLPVPTDNAARFVFKATVSADSATTIQSTLIRQDAVSLAKFKHVIGGRTIWRYLIYDKNHTANGGSTIEAGDAKGVKDWNTVYNAWKENDAVDWMTLDTKDGLEVNGMPKQILKKNDSSELDGSDFSWSDGPGINSLNQLARLGYQEITAYRGFRITAYPLGGLPTVAVFSLKQGISLANNGGWELTPAGKDSPNNATWPDITKYPATWGAING
jgi:RHS repeat-associated protein